jgi:hypothetical protein
MPTPNSVVLTVATTPAFQLKPMTPINLNTPPLINIKPSSEDTPNIVIHDENLFKSTQKDENNKLTSSPKA